MSAYSLVASATTCLSTTIPSDYKRPSTTSAQCLDVPSNSAWMVLYTYDDDSNFLNATSLTRWVTLRERVELQICNVSGRMASYHQLLHRLARFFYLPPVTPSDQAAVPSPGAKPHPLLLCRIDGARSALHDFRSAAHDSLAVSAQCG
ncbi:hypothetical protein PHYSODRAFT_484222 [Phytophthora sojae]|uniref:Uncharacterized protein n=1 Tax=Phytophthora sojae (strain P6497) TaxID=1094619 RepID=G4YRW2_PHYSP|nr:hypothetical protein PHYSODRAFT_484222 [Phytophthora sojae]EGZ22939.1 hypothetical protein PHYSODRAFT_484222 [Phytophthora sojae]|eukprot:XP_009518227.1 hypothetical protein PHYSODRAFT_484222 [Phytophthora sojae]